MPAEHTAIDAHELVSTARDLLRMDDTQTVGLWPRAAALLGRQALEASMDDLWRLVAPGMDAQSARAQLLCLPFLINDRDLGTRCALAWSALSAACHVRVYTVAPVAPELLGWLQTAWDLSECVAQLRARMN